jgi:hypothetical protein
LRLSKVYALSVYPFSHNLTWLYCGTNDHCCSAADAFVDSGLFGVGYTHFHLDGKSMAVFDGSWLARSSSDGLTRRTMLFWSGRPIFVHFPSNFSRSFDDHELAMNSLVNSSASESAAPRRDNVGCNRTIDCWAGGRNSSGYVYPEAIHFPNGMKKVVDYVHSKGLAFGLYTCGGDKTCVGGRPGSKDHWVQDAEVYAEWGVDWVKM